MTNRNLPRREFLRLSAASAGALSLGLQGCQSISGARATFHLATFSADVTPPMGHPLMGGGIAAAQKVDDPLLARGIVLLGGGKPLVIVSVEWCEIRNDAYERWRTVLAEAAQTERERVLVTCVHVHDAPIADLEAERILLAHQAAGSICDLEFHERTVQRVAAAVRESIRTPRRITHFGIGQARVDKVASNRRFLAADGNVSFGRTSSSRDPRAHEQPEGTIDPWLKTLSFWDGHRPLAALNFYATHPMSFYGKGGVSDDFVGLARRRRQADDPDVFQIYLSGCSGNVTAGKYNDGSPENRPVLADRIYRAMAAAWQQTRRIPLEQVNCRVTQLELTPRNDPGFTVEGLTRRLTTDPKPFGQCLAALGLSWRKRADAGFRIDVSVIDFGGAQLVLLPAESYVEFQLLAQRLRPDSFVCVAGYGECAPGYIPIERAWQENDTNLNDWCWVAPGAEKSMTAVLAAALKPPARGDR